MCWPLLASEVELRSPLTTVVEEVLPIGAGSAVIELSVPAGVPADLGVGVCAIDRDGGWWQRPLGARLKPGKYRFDVDLSAAAALASEPPPATWTPLRRTTRLGVYLWSSSASRARIGVVVQVGKPASATIQARLTAVQPGPSRLAVGERYEVAVRLEPAPSDPWGEDPALTLRISEPGGGVREVSGFLRERPR